MINSIAIEVTHVSKHFTYSPGSSRDLKTNLIQFAKNGFRRQETKKIRLDVLEDISFSIYKGEFVGIMGRNGVGKSTILKLITGIYQPNSGSIKTYGDIAPLLELGAGFSPELSGYDNIFLNAAILGYGRKRTLLLVDAIIDFAELREKIYLPVKKYSSGMLVRLGFSIAVHLDAPILLFDEVLGVGDAGFAAKCLAKVHEIHKSGRTIVLVTHSPESVRAHCSRCIVLDEKKKVFDGEPERGAEIYLGAFSAVDTTITSN